MKSLTVLLVAILSSTAILDHVTGQSGKEATGLVVEDSDVQDLSQVTVADHQEAQPRQNIEHFLWDPFQMESLNSTSSVNLCVRNISERAQVKCGLDPSQYKYCCPGNAADCLKQFDCGKTEGAADYFDALLRIGAAIPTCKPEVNCRRLTREDVSPLSSCLQYHERSMRNCSNMDAETETKCRNQNETLTCFKNLVANCANISSLAIKFLEAVPRADYHRYCRDIKPDDSKPDDDEGGAANGGEKGWGNWLLVLGVLALVLLAVVGLVVLLCFLLKIKKQKETSFSEKSSNAVESSESTKSQRPKVAQIGAKVGPQVGPKSDPGQAFGMSEESMRSDSIPSPKPVAKSGVKSGVKSRAKTSHVDPKLVSKAAQASSST